MYPLVINIRAAGLSCERTDLGESFALTLYHFGLYFTPVYLGTGDVSERLDTFLAHAGDAIRTVKKCPPVLHPKKSRNKGHTTGTATKEASTLAN